VLSGIKKTAAGAPQDINLIPKCSSNRAPGDLMQVALLAGII